ncbi:hypothetical protein HKCCSP123_14220 [Rhodobacterales bacterium HKCCSP123]|nr:hypothetical protein [Rhodobacterales bacterium HKCCSP123]
MPVAIYQETVDALNATIMARDIEGFYRLVALPFFVSLPSSQVIISSVEELDLMLCDFHAQLRHKKVTQYRRICLQASFQQHDRNMIVGVHRSEILSHGTYVVEPFLVHSAFIKVEGVWRNFWEQVVINQTHLELIHPDLIKAQSEAQKRMAARSGSDI